MCMTYTDTERSQIRKDLCHFHVDCLLFGGGMWRWKGEESNDNYGGQGWLGGLDLLISVELPK